MTELDVGDRVAIKADLDFWPNFDLSKGQTGVVVWCDKGVVWVKMDQRIVGCEEWGNEVGFGFGCAYGVDSLERK